MSLVPGPAAAEAEVVPLDDRLRPELPHEHVLEERLRAERQQRGTRAQDDDVIRAAACSKLGAVGERGERRARRAGSGCST